MIRAFTLAIKFLELISSSKHLTMMRLVPYVYVIEWLIYELTSAKIR